MDGHTTVRASSAGRRLGRFFKQAGNWYFHTREKTVEGPFDNRRQAEDRLETYLSLTGSGFTGLTGQIPLEPIQLRWR